MKILAHFQGFSLDCIEFLGGDVVCLKVADRVSSDRDSVVPWEGMVAAMLAGRWGGSAHVRGGAASPSVFRLWNIVYPQFLQTICIAGMAAGNHAEGTFAGIP